MNYRSPDATISISDVVEGPSIKGGGGNTWRGILKEHHTTFEAPKAPRKFEKY